MSLDRLTLDEMMMKIGEKSPTPGGGAVVGVCAALASSLAMMIVRYSQGRPSAQEHEGEYESLLGEFERAGAMFTELAAEDMRAYAALSELLKLDKADARRDAELPKAVRRAAGVPMSVMALCHSLMQKYERLAVIANPWLISDLAIAAELTSAAGVSAAYLVRANASLLAKHVPGDDSLAQSVQLEQKLLETVERLRDRARSDST